ncbi:MAG TPA: hypothetical protein DEO84_09575 [candidate division Zixibacteria bacterium]|nr:hypothetical protein [candidate division Zixibacteria bacterium]HBZ01553.1 hypothetical protein [candidate division Zixibacteria bacterium]
MKTKLVLIALTLFLVFAACTNNLTNPTIAVPIAIGTPADGAVLTDPQNITALSGQGYIFTRVDFYIDSLLVGSDSTLSFQYYFNIFNFNSGSSHSIYVMGFTSDSSYASQLIHVTIQYDHGFSYISTYRPGSQHAVGVTNYYNALFISTGDAGLEVLDITNKSRPTFRSRLDTPGQALHSAIEYPFVYIADRDQGVTMANFSNVDSLIYLHRYISQSLTKDVAVSDNYILAVENDGLSILAQVNLQPYSRRIFQDILNYVVTRHDTAYVVGDNGFYIIDCTDPVSSTLVGSYNNLGQGKGAAIADTFAFIANGSDGVIVLSIAHPANPRFLARFNPGQNMTTVTAGTGFLFAGSYSNMVYALDYTSQPGTIQIVDSFNAGNLVEEITFNSYHLYVAANTDIEILRFVP